MIKIKDIIAREIYDSRGNPTVECDLILADGSIGRASVPSGASKGKNEELEKRDGGNRLGGLGVREAIRGINGEIKYRLVGQGAEQKKIDDLLIELDGTANKRRLGANALLAISIALLKAQASSDNLALYQKIENIFGAKTNHYRFPYPLINVINGGKHADDNLDFQEFIIVPMGAESFAEAMEMAGNVFISLKKVLKEERFSVSVGDEGGFAPNLRNNEQAINLIMRAIESAGYKPGKDIFLALDVAADSFYNSQEELYFFKSQYKKRNREKMIEHFSELSKKYPIFSIEDPLYEKDFAGWQEITRRLGSRLQIVGDDFFVTNPEKIKRGFVEKMGNAVIIKPNQIGTVSETLEAIRAAKDNSFVYIISHRSGDTEDSFIADLAWGTKAKQIKSGSFSRSERMCKYNQLLRIEEDIKNKRNLSSFKSEAI